MKVQEMSVAELARDYDRLLDERESLKAEVRHLRERLGLLERENERLLQYGA